MGVVSGVRASSQEGLSGLTLTLTLEVEEESTLGPKMVSRTSTEFAPIRHCANTVSLIY